MATTLGETAGDTVTMTMKLGYLAGTGVFMSVLVVLVWRQITAKRFRPFLYWATIIASTTAGTALADFATRSLGIRLYGRIAAAAGLRPGLSSRLAFEHGIHLFRHDQHPSR